MKIVTVMRTLVAMSMMSIMATKEAVVVVVIVVAAMVVRITVRTMEARTRMLTGPPASMKTRMTTVVATGAAMIRALTPAARGRDQVLGTWRLNVSRQVPLIWTWFFRRVTFKRVTSP